MIPVVKQNIIEQNNELIAERIKELAYDYEIDEAKVEEYFKTIVSKILLNDNIRITEDLSDVSEILESVTSDQASFARPKEEEERTLLEAYRPFDESIDYYINSYYGIHENPENIQIITLPKDDFNVLISGLIEETGKYITEVFGSYFYETKKETINSYANYIYDKCITNNIEISFSDFTNVEKVQYVFRSVVEYFLTLELDAVEYGEGQDFMPIQELIDKLLKQEFNIEKTTQK